MVERLRQGRRPRELQVGGRGDRDDLVDVSEAAALDLSLVPGNPRLSGLTMMRITFHDIYATWGEHDELTQLGALELGICMLDHNLVRHAIGYLSTFGIAAEQRLGGFNVESSVTHATLIEFRWRGAQAAYKLHFFGGDDDRERLLCVSIDGHIDVLIASTNALGVLHPMTLEIRASLKLCFEEQLDWTLDDIPREFIEKLDWLPRPPGHKVFWR